MRGAQSLYEEGFITYHRTDSTNLSTEAVLAVRGFIRNVFGSNYLPPQARIYKTKSKVAQEAHEAIRPTDLSLLPSDIKNFLTTDQFKLYDLIWRRTLASQTQTAILDSTVIDIQAGQFGLRANGSVIKFPGWLKIYPQTTKEEFLPQVREKEELNLIEVKTDQHFTEPPARFTDASLIKTLEKEGVGRPSTYAPTISTLLARNYVIRERRYFKPEEIGLVVSDLLTKHFPNIVDLKFTAKMENKLDDIARGQIAWQKVIDEFYQPFSRELMKKTKTIARLEEKTDKVCPECGKNLVIKFGRFGKFYACPGFPECKYTEPLDTEGSAELKQLAVGQKCDKCGRELVVKNGRFGPFLACSGYPDCKNIKSINKKTGTSCPECKNGEIVEKRSKKGKTFYACDQYPSCKYALWQKPTSKKCPNCGSLLVYAAEDKIKCSSKDCGFEKKQIKSKTT